MSDTPKQPPRSISEISHLFLSSVREQQTGSAPRPVRIPPPRPAADEHHEPNAPDATVAPAHSLDLTPEEYALVMAGGSVEPSAHNGEVRIPPVTAVIAQHLNGRAPERVRDYARHLAAKGERVGVLEVDAGEIRLMCVERSIEPNAGDPQPPAITEHFDARFMTESLDEMSWDLDRWLLVLPNLRGPEARGLLKEVDHWALLSTCDHDGVVSCYRTLKGLSGVVSNPPRMTLALMEAGGEAQAAKVFRKLQSVCLQFLGIELAGEPAVRPTAAVAEHLVAHVRPTKDKAQLSGGAQWLVINAFLAKAKAQAAAAEASEEEAGLREDEPEAEKPEIPSSKSEPNPKDEMRMTETAEMPAAAVVSPVVQTAAPVLMMPTPAPAPVATATTDAAISEVIDLAGGVADESSVLAAILGGAGAELIECPVRPPMCPAARLAVTRDRGLVLLAVARRGLSELRAISAAYRWLVENRGLIAMAVPQLALDAHAMPRLRLIVDHADTTAETLAPMLATNTVTVQAYRTLRWGGRTGLLLEAA